MAICYSLTTPRWGAEGNTTGCSRVEEQGDEAFCVDAGVGGKQEYEAGTMDGWMDGDEREA